jgi:nickel-dependent lactate racemase
LKKAQEAPTPEAKAIMLQHAKDEHRHAVEDKLVQEGKASEILEKSTSKFRPGTHHNPHNVAEVNPDNSVWINPKVPVQKEGINMRRQAAIYERAIIEARKQNMSEEAAKQYALGKSHAGLTHHQIQVMEGEFGSISRGS